MPELPEVEASRVSIEEHFLGQTILQVTAFQDDKVMEGVDAPGLERMLQGRRLDGVRRRGKHLWLELQGDTLPRPLFHLGMAGAIEIRGASVVKYKRALKQEGTWPPKWCKVALEFDGGGALAFVDSRRFGKIRVALKPEESPPISDLGPDALLELPPPGALAELLQRNQRAIKAVLLDQAVLCGIGNWVADEVLYQARVHPESRASALSQEDFLRLHSSIQDVLSFSVGVRADSGLFPDSWLFHVRWDKKPGSIGGNKITFITVGGRTSAVVLAVQKIASGAKAKQPAGKEESEEKKPGKSVSNRGNGVKTGLQAKSAGKGKRKRTRVKESSGEEEEAEEGHSEGETEGNGDGTTIASLNQGDEKQGNAVRGGGRKTKGSGKQGRDTRKMAINKTRRSEEDGHANGTVSESLDVKPVVSKHRSRIRQAKGPEGGDPGEKATGTIAGARQDTAVAARAAAGPNCTVGHPPQATGAGLQGLHTGARTRSRSRAASHAEADEAGHHEKFVLHAVKRGVDEASQEGIGSAQRSSRNSCRGKLEEE